MSDSTNQTIVRVLRPFVRYLLRQGVLFHHFMDLVRWVYVDVAFESTIDGRKPSKSRVSVLTGLSRVEVARQRERGIEDTDDGARWHRAGRVLSAWATEEAYRGDDGRPRTLSVMGDAPSFEDLVVRHSGGATVRSVLDEMVRVGAVRHEADGRVSLLKPYFLTDGAEHRARQLELLGWSAGSLLDTLEHNTRERQGELRFQRLVFEEGLPHDRMPALRAELRARAQAFADQTDGFLTQVKAESASDDEGPRIAHAGLGIYYFERPGEDPRRTKDDE